MISFSRSSKFILGVKCKKIYILKIINIFSLNGRKYTTDPKTQSKIVVLPKFLYLSFF
jgi:hypothetical protein